jgi:hypothetical protein
VFNGQYADTDRQKLVITNASLHVTMDEMTRHKKGLTMEIGRKHTQLIEITKEKGTNLSE